MLVWWCYQLQSGFLAKGHYYYVEFLLTIQNSIREEFKCRLNVGKTCYCSEAKGILKQDPEANIWAQEG